jgi:hypothetical protein
MVAPDPPASKPWQVGQLSKNDKGLGDTDTEYSWLVIIGHILENIREDWATAKGNTQLKHDTTVLNKPGYAQELFREMGWFSNCASAFSTISILTGLIQLYGYGVALFGGAVFWTWVLVGVFQLFNALSMGEIASSFPLAGGVYPWAPI